MEIYKESARLGLRFATDKGNLTTEQLFQLKPEQLDAIAVQLDEEYKASGGKSFLKKRVVKDREVKLKLDIVLDVMNTKVDELEAAQKRAEDKAWNERIAEVLAGKEDEGLKGKTPAQLRKMFR